MELLPSRQRIVERLLEPQFARRFLKAYLGEGGQQRDQRKAAELVGAVVHEETGIKMRPPLFALVVKEEDEKVQERRVGSMLPNNKVYLKQLERFRDEVGGLPSSVYSKTIDRPELGPLRHHLFGALNRLTENTNSAAQLFEKRAAERGGKK